MPLAFEAIDALWYGLSVLCVLVAIGLAYLLIRLGGTVGQLTSFLKGLEREVLPVINETGGTLQRVNSQLDKADLITDSAVDIADSADTAVRAVSFAITRPVQLIAGLAEGIAHGFASLRVRKSPKKAYETGRDAAHRREAEIADGPPRPLVRAPGGPPARPGERPRARRLRPRRPGHGPAARLGRLGGHGGRPGRPARSAP
jgi:hypothetical protein